MGQALSQAPHSVQRFLLNSIFVILKRPNTRTNGYRTFIIDYIDHHGPCSMIDIVEAMNMTPSTATRQVDRLVDWDLVAREPSKSDRRRVILSVTARGTQASKKFVKHRMKNLRPILRPMSEKETEVLVKLLERVVERL